MTQLNFIPLQNAPKQTWDQLYGCSLSLALAEYCTQTPGVKLLIAPDNLRASALKDELLFFLADNTQEILLFPDWETLPYDQFSPHQDLISQRLYTLNRMQHTHHAIVIIAASTLMHRICPPQFLSQHGLVLKIGQNIDINAFRHNLQQGGYYSVNTVLEHGEFAIRGSIIDLYPMGQTSPFRIELLDNEIESLRRFDPDSQRTVDKIDAINILPAREFPLHDGSISLFRRFFREFFPVNPSQCPIYEAVSNKQFPSGIEYYLPLFFEQTATLFDYLPKDAHICLLEPIQEQAEAFWQEASMRYEQRRYDVTRPLVKPDILFLSPTQLLTLVNQHSSLRLHQNQVTKKGTYHFPCEKAAPLFIDRKASYPLERLAHYLSSHAGRHLLVVESAGRREVLFDLLKPHNLSPRIQASWSAFLKDTASLNIIVGPLSEGVELLEPHISIIAESQLFGEQSTPQVRRAQKGIDPDFIIRDLAELRMGAPVVHTQFGVGRYQGLKTIAHDEQTNEFLVITYANEDKIYVPVTSLHLISRYTGADSEHAPLHHLGSDQWQKAKKKAAERIHDVAIELLDIYAKREAASGHRYTVHSEEYQRFVCDFPFEETEDQLLAIEQITRDLQSPRPMDRLICGDVGFGKTEVAMRAALIAVQNDRQVCVLVPTTLLAGQHFETFRDRFAEFPFRIELLSRFKSQKESQQVLEALKDGRADIIIGTHKLLQQGIQFRNLGLLIIDEEHRFGVKQKEHIKSLRANVDILSMTATPIPRTLNMAMAGIRDVSLISTPPAKRLAVKTFWQERQDSILREAILREVLRGGQVFFVHNHIQTIGRIQEELEILVPEAKVVSAHGQMRERELERIMSDFYHHRFNVLVCTTIIETGIDIPTANTIVIDQAHQFGLAQLHQLRGRVGRSHHQAYAYLLTPHEKLLTADAIKRLEAIVSLETLGAGFALATHDLEIRGAGELLGAEQSGNMEAVGFNLFMEMLNQAVEDLKAGRIPELAAPMHTGPDIELSLSAIIPEDYIADVHTRLIFYKRISNAQNKQQLHDLQIEMIDRFGLLPLSVKHLLLVTDLKLLALQLKVKRIQANPTQGKIEFLENAPINATTLIHLIQVHAKRYQMDGPTRLRFSLDAPSAAERIHEIYELLIKLKS